MREDKAEVMKWAAALLEQPEDFIVLDTETTGLDSQAEVVEIALLRGDGEPLLNQRIKPQNRIPYAASNIHGITNRMVKECPSFPEVYPRLAELLAGKKVIIYNAEFDRKVLWHVCHRHGLGVLNFDAQCAMLQYAIFIGEWNEYRGSYKWQKLFGGDHSALGDCWACLKAVKDMAGINIVVNMADIGNRENLWLNGKKLQPGERVRTLYWGEWHSGIVRESKISGVYLEAEGTHKGAMGQEVKNHVYIFEDQEVIRIE